MAFRNNLLKGIGLGLFVATGFSLWVTILLATSGTKAFDSLGTSYGAVIGLYYAGGLAGGVLIGLAWPLRSSIFGSGFLGILGVFPLYLGAAFLLSPHSRWLTQDNISGAVLLALLVGLPLGIWSWLDDNPPPPWIRALLHPAPVTVGIAWLVTIVLAGGSFFFLTKWTGSWPEFLVILTVLVLFAVPIGTALFLTLRLFRGPVP